MTGPLSPRQRLRSLGVSRNSAVHRAKELVAARSGELRGAGGDDKSARVGSPPETAAPLPQLNLRMNLIKYTRGNNRSMVMSLLRTSRLLRAVAMEPVDGGLARSDEFDWLRLEEEVAQNRLVLNDIHLGGPSDTRKRELFLVLENLCQAVANEHSRGRSGGGTMTTEQLFQAVVLRLAPSVATRDAHPPLKGLIASPDLMLLSARGKDAATPAPARLDLYADGDGIHMVTETAHRFGLLRKLDLATHAKRPWVTLVVTVHERTNLATGNGVRYCTVDAAEETLCRGY